MRLEAEAPKISMPKASRKLVAHPWDAFGIDIFGASASSFQVSFEQEGGG
jgi:hypothetical protein